MGDVIQFVRYAPALKALGANVQIGAFTALEGLLRGANGIDRVVERVDAGTIDYYVHVQSLPRVFGTELETIPSEVPYLHADAQRVAGWRSRLPAGGGLKVGLVWAGNPQHSNDRNRSIRLESLHPRLRA